MPSELDSLFERLTRFRSAWVSRGWSWDKRLDCVASTFDLLHIEEARRVAVSLFTEEWTSASLRAAPPLVVEVAEATGGVRSDQVLYALPEVRGVLAYGLWWPWGSDGTNISLRVGITGPSARGEVVRLRQIFGALED